MNGADVIAEILKREGITFLSCYPRNPLIDACARVDIRPVICRQERVGVGIADGYSRASHDGALGVFAAQLGPGIENAFPGVAQAYADNSPILVLPSAANLDRPGTPPVFYPADTMAPITKWAARVHHVSDLPHLLRRAFQQLRGGRPGPVLLELPEQILSAPFEQAIDYQALQSFRFTPDPAAIEAAAHLLLNARCPLIWAGQGVLRARATEHLVAVAELLVAPVMTTNPGKSAFPEHHNLSLGAAAVHAPPPLKAMLAASDVVLAVGTSLTASPFNPAMPPGKKVIHNTVNEADINKDVRAELALLGDAGLTLKSLHETIHHLTGGQGRPDLDHIPDSVKASKQGWLDSWKHQFGSGEMPINPYRLICDLMATVDRNNTIITHDAGSPREHLVPFWETTCPGGYLGWGKSTQLGHGLGLIMGAKLANPEKLCINWMGDAAFCMVGMDLDTAARNQIPILTIVLNNGVMACERDHLIESRQKYDAFDIGGNYSQIAAALGVWSRRIERPDDFIPALKEAISLTEAGRPAFIECITKECYDFA